MAKRKQTETRPKGRREFGWRQQRQSILIVCEGEKTEPNYFQDFRDRLKAGTISIKIKGTGFNTYSLVEEALRLKKEAIRQSEPHDQVWCVFDEDDVKPEIIEAAFRLARENDIKIAFSNECFELWYVLHFQYMESAFKRNQLKKKVTALFQEHFPDVYPSKPARMRRSYDKNDKGIFGLLFKFMADAQENAKKLQGSHSADQPSPKPTTTVYLLVDELNKLDRP
jgi:hypothetical protein